MEKEIFTFEVEYKGETIPVEIRAAVLGDTNNTDYEVLLTGQMAFIINPHIDIFDAPCWQLKFPFKGVDLEFVSSIGMEIERHYL